MRQDKTNKYDANFTAGGILYHEFFAMKEILLSDNFDERIKIEEEQNNVIGIKTLGSRKRIISEIKRRYNNAPLEFWSHFFDWNEKEQKLALFFLCLKTYPLILDIHFEVAIKKFKTGNKLDAYDIQMRMDEIASSDEEVSKWSDKTLKKINVQYRKAIKDVGLYNGKTLFRESKAPISFWNYFKINNEAWFLEACFVNIH
jgi:hypothetical protein